MSNERAVLDLDAIRAPTVAPAPAPAPGPAAAPAPADTPQPERGFIAEYNRDGSCIVKLTRPVAFVVDGRRERVERLTIPALTGRHMRLASWSLADGANIGDMISFACEVVEPVGIVDALPAWVARQVSVEVFIALGKSQGDGEVSSR